MAGTLVITTLSDGTNSTSATNCIQGSAKAWVNFNGSAGTVRSSYNVSSVTVNGTGDYTVNFTNAFSDANYCLSGYVGYFGNTTTWLCGRANGSQSDYTTTSARVATSYQNTLLTYYTGYVCVEFNR